jgi:hypothetical protein
MGINVTSSDQTRVVDPRHYAAQFRHQVRHGLMDTVRFRLDHFTIGGLSRPVDESVLDEYKAALNEQGFDMRWEVRGVRSALTGRGTYSLTLVVKPIKDLHDPVALPP